MKQVLLGYRPYEFKDRESGRQVEGVSLYTQFESDGVTGYETAKLTVASVPEDIDNYLGIEVDIDFSPKGKVVQIHYPKPVNAK